MSTVTDFEACEHVSSNVLRLLDEQGHSVYWLMKELGMSPGALYPIVRGENVPTLGTTSRIADALGVTVDDLLELPRKREEKRSLKKSRKSA